MQTMRVGIARFSCLFGKPVPLGLLASLLALVSFATIFLRGNAQSPLSGNAPSSSLASTTSIPTTPATSPLQPAAAPNASNPNQQIGQLLQMATDLKAEVGKTNQETLSVAVVRKAAAIEQLAHRVRIGGSQK